jgi:hypothetical protein
MARVASSAVGRRTPSRSASGPPGAHPSLGRPEEALRSSGVISLWPELIPKRLARHPVSSIQALHA